MTVSSESVLATSSDLTGSDAGSGPHYSFLVAENDEQIRQAQRLRYQVFAEEMGASLHSEEPGLDTDHFDRHCDHLLVRADSTGEIVGSYRMLPPERVAAAGGYYAETEFELGGLNPLRDEIVETGRSCVHAEHRTGAVINLVWAGLARYMVRSGHNYLMGCASVPLHDGGALAAAVWQVVSAGHMSDQQRRARPLQPWDYSAAPQPEGKVGMSTVPPLLRGYLRLGSTVCAEPAHDPDFGVADLLVLLSLSDMDPRYLNHFLGGAQA